MFKDSTLRQISVAVTVIFCLTNLVLLFIMDHFYTLDLSVTIYLTTFFLTVLICFLTVRFWIEKYLLRKIKLIYKVINSSKGSAYKNSNFEKNMSFELVESDVAKWAESAQDEIENLKSLESYRKNYVGNISHELKTPIFSIQGFLHTLLDGAMYDEDKNRSYLVRAAANADRLQTIVEDLEVINQLENKASKLNEEVFDLTMLCLVAIEEVELKAEMHDIKILFNPEKQRNFSVVGDKNGIHQVLINLLTNSLKYGTQGGETKIEFFDMDDRVLVEVTDNGIGIEEKHMKHLFDRFYRVDSSRSREMGGSGLGLSIVKHIIEAHNQTITVRSKEGVGSTFGFTIAKA